MSYNTPSILIVGPSTTGKTEIAFKIAELVGGEVINADKFYLFKGFPSMTGLPDFSRHPTIKHHLYEILNPEEETLEPEDFSRQLERVEKEIRERGKIPIIEGCYWKFVRSILNSGRAYICIGIKWSSISNLQERIQKRVYCFYSLRLSVAEQISF